VTPAEHRAEAERLLAKARAWERSAASPDAAGSAIRDGWRAQAAVWRQEALVHAQLGTAPDQQIGDRDA
jgi:hypothetical protein